MIARYCSVYSFRGGLLLFVDVRQFVRVRTISNPSALYFIRNSPTVGVRCPGRVRILAHCLTRIRSFSYRVRSLLSNRTGCWKRAKNDNLAYSARPTDAAKSVNTSNVSRGYGDVFRNAFQDRCFRKNNTGRAVPNTHNFSVPSAGRGNLFLMSSQPNRYNL